MKQIIHGKTYDTASSKRIASDDTGDTLYRTKRGAYFLAPAFWPGQEDGIEPISYADAAVWCNACDKAAFEREFATPAENPDIIRVCVSMRRDIAAAARQAASRNGMNLSEYISSRIERSI